IWNDKARKGSYAWTAASAGRSFLWWFLHRLRHGRHFRRLLDFDLAEEGREIAVELSQDNMAFVEPWLLIENIHNDLSVVLFNSMVAVGDHVECEPFVGFEPVAKLLQGHAVVGREAGSVAGR